MEVTAVQARMIELEKAIQHLVDEFVHDTKVTRVEVVTMHVPSYNTRGDLKIVENKIGVGVSL